MSRSEEREEESGLFCPIVFWGVPLSPPLYFLGMDVLASVSLKH